MPGEVTKEPFGFVASPYGEPAIFGSQIEQCDHAHPRHHVATPSGIGVRLVGEVAVNSRGDVYCPAFDSKRVYYQLRMVERVLAGRPVGKAYSDHIGRADSARREKRSHGRVNSAGHSNDALLES